MAFNPYPLDLDEFRSWLLAHPSDASVGRSCDDVACPLACFLNAQFEGSSFLVHHANYERLMDDVSLGVECTPDLLPLPSWAQVFVSLVDASANFWEEAPVASSVALACLTSACGGVSVPPGEG